MTIRAVSLGVTFALAVNLAVAADSSFPTRPITLVLPVSTGSATDILMRIMAERVSAELKTPVIVKNDSGANGLIATQSVIRSAPDGYTALAMSTNQVTNSFLYSKLGFDTKNDLKGIVRLVSVPMVLCVNSSHNFNTLSQFIEAAKRSSDHMNFASAGNGSTGQLAMLQLQNRTNVTFAHVPYKGTAQAQQDLIGGQVDTMFVVPTAAQQVMKTNAMKCLGVGSRNRIAQLPDVPTIEESGFPGFEAIAWVGVSVPAATPDAVAQRLSEAFLKVMEQPDIQTRISGMGLTPAPMDYAAFRPYLVNEYTVWGDFIKKNNIKSFD